MSKLTLKNLCKHYNANAKVIDNLNLEIESGELIVIVGPSGCGKSTLLRMIAGLEKITHGEMLIDGNVVNELTPQERGVGMVFQSYALYPHMTVRENMLFPLKMLGFDKAKADKRVNYVAASLQLEKLLDRKPKDLSGGQRQRVAMGRAMVREPRLFLFDEPLSNLDASLRVQMRMEVANLHKRLESTIVYVTHDQVEAMTLANRIVVLNKGKIEQVGTPMELYDYPANTFVAQFIGSPLMNLIPARVLATGHHTLVGLANGEKLRLPIATPDTALNIEALLGIRPEHVSTSNEGTGHYPASVLFSEQMGNECYVYLDNGNINEPWIVRHPGRMTLTEGDKLELDFPPEHCHLFTKYGTAFPRRRDKE